MIKMENKNIQRNYDKEPIIIKDYNYIFWLLFQLWFIPIIIYIYVKNPGNLSEVSLYTSVFIVIPILIAPSLKVFFYARGKRTIKFLNDEIQFLHKDSIITSIKLSELEGVRKSYTDYYHKSQDLNPLQEIATIIIFPFIFLAHILLIINKYLLIQLLNKSKTKYRINSSILIFSNTSFINVFPTSEKTYLEVKDYILNKKNINIEEQDSIFRYAYFWEKINL